MHIYIDSIDEELSEQGEDSGHRVTFRSGLTCGTALLAVNHKGEGPSFQGKEIFVEVEAQTYQEVRVLLAEEATEYRFTALPQEDCYQLVGEVVYAPPMEAFDYPIIGVHVADALFHWTPDQSDRENLFVGTWVEFKVVGLVLWDMNL